MNVFETKEELLYLIENKRSEMVLVASRTGFLSYQTLKTSEELDELLNLHYQLWGIWILSSVTNRNTTFFY